MILRPVRTTQPQGSARVDWSNPITRGLFSAIDSSGVDYVLGGRGVLWNTNPIAPRFTRFGKAVDFQQNQLDFPTKDYAKVVSNSTHIVVAEKAPQSNWKVAAIHYGSTLRYYGGAMSFLNGVSRANFDGNQWQGVATLGVVQRTNSYFDYALFINGGPLNTTSNTNGDMLDGFVATLGGSALGDRTSTTWWDEAVHLSLRFNRSLSESEMRSITANPWQIFAPDSKSLWVPAAVSVSLPTLVQPSSTTSAGAWTATGAASLHDAINEAVASDTQYISVNSASTTEMLLGEAAFPGGSTQAAYYDAFSTDNASITVVFKQGSTEISRRTHLLTPTNTRYSTVFTPSEIALIIAGPISVTLTSS